MRNDQTAELEKYQFAYDHQKRYHMKGLRQELSAQLLAELPTRGSYLDVSCGRGEMLAVARDLGFAPVEGTEALESLCVSEEFKVHHATSFNFPLPDKAYDVTTCFDVIEHLIPKDEGPLIQHLLRVTRKHVFFTINNRPSRNARGDNLHINIHTYAKWDRIVRKICRGHEVHNLGPLHTSVAWRVDICEYYP